MYISVYTLYTENQHKIKCLVMLWFLFFFLSLQILLGLLYQFSGMFIQEHIYVCVLVYEQSDWYIRISHINYRSTYQSRPLYKFSVSQQQCRENTRAVWLSVCTCPRMLPVFDCFCSMYIFILGIGNKCDIRVYLYCIREIDYAADDSYSSSA